MAPVISILPPRHPESRLEVENCLIRANPLPVPSVVTDGNVADI